MNTANTRRGFFSWVTRSVRLSVVVTFPFGLAACGGTSDTTPMCSASTMPQVAEKFCAPSNIAAGQPLRLQIREQCGGCTSRATKCEVVVSGMDVKLNLMGEVCVLAPNTACPAICSISVFDCAVPALAAGTYRVTTSAGTTTVSMMTADTTTSATSCTVPAF